MSDEQLYHRVAQILEQARGQGVRTVNGPAIRQAPLAESGTQEPGIGQASLAGSQRGSIRSTLSSESTRPGGGLIRQTPSGELVGRPPDAGGES